MFHIRAVVIDSYMARPITELYDKNDKNIDNHSREPVIRIFGSTPDGIKSCVHVHGVFPYLYVPYKGGENPDRDALILGAALDEALKITFNQLNNKFIYKVVIISGIPLYGYHSTPRQFFKIFFYNPYHIRKTSELLLKGAILGQKLQPHESHIPYVLQFMIDYNIYGMNFVSFSNIKYRQNPENPELLVNIKNEFKLSTRIKKVTCSHLEVDAIAMNIINVDAEKTIGANPGILAIWNRERMRRLEKNKGSLFTAEPSLSRQELVDQPTEAMYKERLAVILNKIRFEKPAFGSIKLDKTYPAEVPADSHFLEASFLNNELSYSPTDPEDVPDVKNLIDEKILSQIMGDSNEIRTVEEVEEDAVEVENDSILGKKVVEGEAEAESEDESGDMTQPLDAEGDFACDSSSNGEDQRVEKQFWENMADKIIQVDGGQDCSSDSDVETAFKTVGINCCLEKEINSDLVSTNQTISSETMSNLFSVLYDSVSGPSSQASPSFSSNFSPRMDGSWLSQNQELWCWDKGETTFSDYFRTPGSCDFSVAPLNKTLEDISCGEASENLYVSNQFFENTKSELLLNPSNLIESNDSVASPFPILTSANLIEHYSDMSVNPVRPAKGEIHKSVFEINESQSIIKAQPTESKKMTVSNCTNNLKIVNCNKSVFDVKNPDSSSCQKNKVVSLTLKQYLKDFGEIINVDLKNFRDQEMVVVEYKPLHWKSTRSKFFIKPLDKFLENWNTEEKKINDQLQDKCLNKNDLRVELLESEKLKLNRQIENSSVSSENKCKNDLLDAGNKCVLKSLETFTDYSESMPRINKKKRINKRKKAPGFAVTSSESVKQVSNGIEVKGHAEKRSYKVDLNSNKLSMCPSLELNKSKLNEFVEMIRRKQPDKVKKSVLNSESGNSYPVKKTNFNSKKESNCTGKILNKTGKMENRGNLSELDNKLIDQINSRFEDYFQNILKVNNKCNENNLFQNDKKNVKSFEDDKLSECVKEKSRKTSEEKSSKGKSANHESVQFVAQLLSAFSQMSKSSEIPPLSITINIGNCSNLESAPIRLNVQSPTNLRKVTTGSSKKSKRKLKIPNTDGPADGSSSDDSAEPLSEEHSTLQKKMKKDNHYKALDVFLHKSDSINKETRRKKSFKTSLDGDESDFSYASSTARDSSDLCRKNPLTNRTQLLGKRIQNQSESSCHASSLVSESGLNKKQNFELFKEEEDYINGSDAESDAFMTNEDIRKSVKSKKRAEKNQTKREKTNEESEKKPSQASDKNETVSNNRPSETKKGSADTGMKVLEPLNLTNAKPMLDQTLFHIPSKWLKAQNQMENIKDEDFLFESPDLFDVEKCAPASSCCQKNYIVSSSESSKPSSEAINEPENSRSPKEVVGQLDLVGEIESSEAHLGQTKIDSLLSFPKSSSCENSSSTEIDPKSCYESNAGSSSSVTSALVKENSESEIPVVKKYKIIRPLQVAPSWQEVRHFLFSNENMKEITDIPYYSNPSDVVKTLESGPLVLKVETNAVEGLKPYKSSLNLVGMEELESKVLNFGRKGNRNRIVTITPLKKPPLSSAVLQFLNRENSKAENETVQNPKLKIVVPLSPGQESEGEEMEISVSSDVSSLKCESSSSNSAENRLSFTKQNLCESSKNKNVFSQSKEKGKGSVPKPMETICEDAVSSKVTTFEPKREIKELKLSSDDSFQIRGVTLENTFGFENSIENLQDAKLKHTYQYITLLVLEVHTQARENLRPDPAFDPIRALFYTVSFDSPVKNQNTGAIIVEDVRLSKCAVPTQNIHRVPDEKSLILKLVELIKIWDPDILSGYEIEMRSWGYLVQRASILELNLISMLRRVQCEFPSSDDSSKCENEDFDNVWATGKLRKITGRIVLDIWRILRSEVALTSYTFENVMYHLAHERHPLLSYKQLSYYWEHPSDRFRHITFEFYLTRVLGVMKLLESLDLINRVSEFARLFGIQFYEVLSRGSQFRVESMMLRLAKPLNYVAVSPSIAQRAAMRAPASLPLILEPESKFYSDPLVVLDFQSLYPSMIIAYNYCFSTCLGRIDNIGGREPFEFGCTELQVLPEEIKKLKNDVTISPAGVVFVKSNIRKGVLPIMLEEILETRLMVKKSLKENKGDKVLKKVLHSQQLGLKLIANVTYGYTAANFSGRMPCIEVGDSVVSKGRETLHRAIQLIKSNTEWKARVVYGDTDSIFVLMPGRTRKEAFQIGAEIADAVTKDNPRPVKLKLEKIYQPSILQTKKRYVGYMYETAEQVNPVFEAKGIETVRRDGCPAVGKILQKALQILFDTKDVSLVKKYTIRQFRKISEGRVNIQDLIFAKEYRGRFGYRPGACVPALYLAKQWTQHDRRAEPRVKERVPYVIVNGPPGVPLIKLVRSPSDLISNPSLRINALYYITKAIIPPMHRCFSLMGVDVAGWYLEMPKKLHKEFKTIDHNNKKRATISQHFSSAECFVCSRITHTPVCSECQKDPQALVFGLIEKIRQKERNHDGVVKICQSCCKRSTELQCESLDCPVLFRKVQLSRELGQVHSLRQMLNGGLQA